MTEQGAASRAQHRGGRRSARQLSIVPGGAEEALASLRAQLHRIDVLATNLAADRPATGPTIIVMVARLAAQLGDMLDAASGDGEQAPGDD